MIARLLIYYQFSSSERDQYQLGSLSHTINNKAHGYFELPEWPEVAPPSSVRNVAEPASTATAASGKKKSIVKEKEKGFYSESSEEEDSSEEETSEEETSEEGEHLHSFLFYISIWPSCLTDLLCLWLVAAVYIRSSARCSFDKRVLSMTMIEPTVFRSWVK